MKKNTTRRRWYFDERKLPQLERVRRMITSLAAPWTFIMPAPKPSATITLENFRHLVLRSFDESLSGVIILNPLDYKRIVKWLRRKRISLEKFSGNKIVFYSHPLTSRFFGEDSRFYICLVQNENGGWNTAVRNEEYFRAQDYKMACLK